MRIRLVLLFTRICLWGGFLTACNRAEIQPTATPVFQTVIVQITATPHPTVTATQSPTPTPTFTPTSTPTPTALPIEITGDPLEGLAVEPVPQTGALCGFVDYFDFPIDPPDAEIARGGGDFGVYRNRYQSNHAGEDWGLQTRDNFGEPVYVIGHGMVTYSQPYGWGLDQGTVIVRHTYRNGRVVYSFYGHLDPPSVVLRPGDCLVRGDTVGNIGDPSGRPHLHFEIRLHDPDTPGPGYWPVDPMLAGWMPPSQTIWNNRMLQQPGTVWTRFPVEGAQYVGSADGLLFVLEEDELRALNIDDGRVIWRMELETNFPSLMVSEAKGLVYLADPLGHIEALALPTPDMMEPWNNTKVVLQRMWKQELGVNGSPILMPLPDGGVVMALRQMTAAFAADGEMLWEADGILALSDWELEENRLVFSTAGETKAVWEATEAGVQYLADGVGGQLVSVAGQFFLYSQEGVYQVDSSGAVDKTYAFGRGSGRGNMVSISGEGVLIVHLDVSGARLLAFGPDGEVIWERGLRGIEGGQPRLIQIGEEIFLLSEETQSSAAIVHLYRVDMTSSSLVEIFTGGTRTASSGRTWIEMINPMDVLIQIGGGHMILFHPDPEPQSP